MIVRPMMTKMVTKKITKMMANRMMITSVLLVFVGCATSTQEGAIGVKRRQLLLLPSAQVDSMSLQAYEQVKQESASKGTLDKATDTLKRVQKIAQRLTPQTQVFRPEAPQWAWEVHVITSSELNAFCMPGGKIIFYTGLIDELKLSDGEIAAVMGHEIAHALREHGRERMSEQLIEKFGIGAIVESGKIDPKYAVLASGLTTLAVTLPHSRMHEKEADEIGLELMARAGYNPHKAVTLWEKMAKFSGGNKPPEIFSTHPADKTRMRDLEALIPKVMPLYKDCNCDD